MRDVDRERKRERPSTRAAREGRQTGKFCWFGYLHWIGPLGGGVPASSGKRFATVAGLGLCALDHLLVIEDAAAIASRVRYRERLVSPGGMIGTALAQAARLGCATQVVSAVGDDEEGRAIARSLRAAGVGTKHLLRTSRCPTSVAYVLVSARSGERRFVVPDRRAVERRAPPFDLSPIRARSLLLVDGHYPAQAMRAVRRARRCGAVVIGDFSDSRPAFHALLPWVDYPIVPAEFGRTWDGKSPRETLFALREAYGGRPVVTDGARGALALLDGRVRRIPSPCVRVRDTTGAGDVFHGAFAAGLVHGLGELDALRLASRAAATSCTTLGGQARLMTEPEMRREMRRLAA
jgi:sugar/nucleoside kinase (ribokinase family)